LTAKIKVSVEMVDKCIDCMKKGKAAGIDGLTVEHLMYSHPDLVFTTWCTTVQSAVLLLHVVCPSVTLVDH